jgi:flagellar hook-associated protein 1 FlgK
VITAADGRNITGMIERGKLAGGLEFRNEVLTGLQGDSGHAGEINRLAEQIANRINQILTSNWPPPQVGVPLFLMGASQVSVAHTLSVNPGVKPLLLAAIEPAAPSFGEAASKLAALANPTDSADKIDGVSFTGFYARITAGVGQKLATASDGEETQQQLVAQARKMRADVSGVSLDEEAAKLMELQKAYQANARMVSVIDEMMDTILGLLK